MGGDLRADKVGRAERVITRKVSGRYQDGHGCARIRNQPLGTQERDREKEQTENGARVNPAWDRYPACLCDVDAITSSKLWSGTPQTATNAGKAT